MYMFPIPIHMDAHIYQIIHIYVVYLHINNSGHTNSKHFSHSTENAVLPRMDFLNSCG